MSQENVIKFGVALQLHPCHDFPTPIAFKGFLSIHAVCVSNKAVGKII